MNHEKFNKILKISPYFEIFQANKTLDNVYEVDLETIESQN